MLAEAFGGKKIVIACGRTDLRKSIDGLVQLISNAFVIYYDTNSWNFTRLGKVNDVTQQELKEILGDGDVTVELSLSANP